METSSKILEGFEDLKLVENSSSQESQLDSEQESKLDGIINMITRVSDITSEEYYKILAHVQKIPISYYVEIKEEVLKELVLALDKGVVKGPLALFRQEVIGESLDQVMELNIALNAHLLRQCMLHDDTYECLEIIIKNTQQISFLRNCQLFALFIELINKVTIERLKKFGYLNRILYLILEYGKRFVINFNELENDKEERIATQKEKKYIVQGFHNFQHENLSKIIITINARFKQKSVVNKLLKLEDTISISNDVLEWKSFTDWELSHKHYILCFLGNLIQGILSFSMLKYLSGSSKETLMTASSNQYSEMHKNDWALCENHIKFRKGELIYKRMEKEEPPRIPRRIFKSDAFELFDLQKGYNSVFVAYIFTKKVVTNTALMHLIAPKKLVEIAMWLLYDCFESDILEEIIMDLVKFQDEKLVETKLQMIRNSNYFNFNVILLIERVSKYLTNIPINDSSFTIVMDLLKKLFYINHDYIQIAAIKQCLHLNTVKIYSNTPDVKSVLPENGVDAVNLKLNPTIQRVIIGCVEYGIHRACKETKDVKTPYFNYDFIKRMVLLYKSDELLNKISDFSESYIVLYRLLKYINEYYQENRNQLPPDLEKKSILNDFWFEEFFSLKDFNSEIKHHMNLRTKFIKDQLKSFSDTINDKKATQERKEYAENQTKIYIGKTKELSVLDTLINDVQIICDSF